jgi:uncharacterized membrane protein YbhN (UPF0104 family)
VKRLWQVGWRVVLCGLLLAWIFHSIFVDEARRATAKEEWQRLSRQEQWQEGWTKGPPLLWETLNEIQPKAFILSAAIMGVTLVLGVIRWRIVLRVQGLNLSFWRAMEITLVAHFFNSFLLGSTGGDLMKAYYAARETHHKKTEAVVTVFVDRLVGLWAMLLFALAMIIPNIPNLAYLRSMDRVSQVTTLSILGMAAGCTVLAGLAFWGGVSRQWSGARVWLRRLPKGEWLERSLDSCRRFGRDPLFLVKTMGVSTLLNAAVVWQWWVVGQGLGLSYPFKLLLMVVPMVICIAALPITPSGLGVRENLFVHMLSSTTTTVASRALSLSLLAFAGSLLWSLVGGVVYLLFRHRHHLAEEELETANPEDAG